MKVDTGADVSILNYDSYLKPSPLPKLDSPTKKLFTTNGKLEIKGCLNFRINVGDTFYNEQFFIMMPGNKTANLLSRNASNCLGIVIFVESIELNEELFEFGEWQTEPVNFSIKTSRSIAIPLIQPVKLALENMISNNIIEPVTFLNAIPEEPSCSALCRYSR